MTPHVRIRLAHKCGTVDERRKIDCRAKAFEIRPDTRPHGRGLGINKPLSVFRRDKSNTRESERLKMSAELRSPLFYSLGASAYLSVFFRIQGKNRVRLSDIGPREHYGVGKIHRHFIFQTAHRR